jgi:hypothetical protein
MTTMTLILGVRRERVRMKELRRYESRSSPIVGINSSRSLGRTSIPGNKQMNRSREHAKNTTYSPYTFLNHYLMKWANVCLSSSAAKTSRIRPLSKM